MSSSVGRSSVGRSVVRDRVVVRQSYFWPDQQLNFWIIVMLATGGTLIGVFADFVIDQQTLMLPIPWIMPYGITVGALTVFYVIVLILLIFQRRLLPGVVMIGCFILLVLYITGVIETAIQLFGPAGNVSSNCQVNVNGRKSTGVSVNTLAWLQQDSTCSSWYAAFAFWIIGGVFFTWMIVLGSMVSRGVLGD